MSYCEGWRNGVTRWWCMGWGRPSNRGIGKDTEQRAIEALKDPEWHDFGPTFASEQLAKRHGIVASKETVRRWMIGAGLWRSRARGVKNVHGWRPRGGSDRGRGEM